MRVPRLALGALVALLSQACDEAKSPGAGPSRPLVKSNVRSADYAGSGACVPCHRAITKRFFESPMRRMTRGAQAAKIDAPFGGEQLRLGADVATLLTRDKIRFMRLDTQRDGASWWRVTKVIGGRTREDFAGVRVAGPLDRSEPNGTERILPVSWLRFNKRYRYKGYSVMTPERNGLRKGARWRTTCIFCHNTVPTLVASYAALHGPGAPKYQGSVSFLLPKSRAPQIQLESPDALNAALSAELSRLGGKPGSQRSHKSRLVAAIEATREKFSESHLVELGIGCESCHGGGKQHAADPGGARMSFGFQSSFAREVQANGNALTPAQQQTRACARCHTVLFSGYAHTWEQGAQGNGGSHVNSGEARDFMLGGCQSEMSCSHCHDPHARDRPGLLKRLQGAKGVALCTGCHESYADPERRRAHTRHADGQASCIDCHMVKKNMGLAYALTNYHRIGSPTDSERLYRDRPIECAGCHATYSVARMAKALEQWKPRVDRKRLRALYGSMNANVVIATLQRGKSHERATAASMAKNARLTAAVPALLEVLEDPIPLVRLYALDALEHLIGKRIQVDEHLPGPELAAATREFVAR